MTSMRRRPAIVALALLIAALCTNAAAAQSEAVIRGLVVASANGAEVPNAAVTLVSVARGERTQTTADTAGRFTFQNVRPGEYIVSAAAAGFASRERRLAVEPREIANVTVSLELGGIDVSVNVAADLIPSTHSPSSTVLTQARLDTMPVFGRVSLPDAVVTSAPGMIRGHDDFVHIRGHEIALNPLINGVSFWENAHAVFSAGLSPDIIETANIMTGGFPAEYGNRFGGVVDIVTKSGFAMDHSGSFSANGGEAGRRRLAGEFGGHAGRIAYYGFASAFASSRFLSPPEPRAIHDEGRGGDVFAQLDANLGRAGTLRAVLIGGGTNFEIPKALRDVELRPQANADQRTRQQTATLGWTGLWSDVSVNASIYQRWSRSRLMPAAGPLTASAGLTRGLRTIGGKVDVTRFAERHSIKAGVDAVRLSPREDLAYNYAGYRELTHLLGLPHIHLAGQSIAFSGRDSGGQISAYVQDGMQVGHRLSANVGVRLDHYDLLVSKTHFSPRANLALQVGRGASLHASYNHFFVPPPVEGVLSSSAGLTRSINEIARPLPALEPTVEDQFELGLSAPLGPFRAAATGYYRATDNPVHTTVWPDSRIYSYASFDRARAYGLELKLAAPHLARHGITSYANYALGRVQFYNPVTGGFTTESAHLTASDRFLAPMDQTHTVTGGVTWRHAATGLWLGTTIEYGSGTPIGHGGAAHDHAEGEDERAHASSSGAARVPSHVTANVSLGADLLRGTGRRPRLSLQIDVENLSDDVYLIAQDGEFAPTQFSIPRLISATVKVRF